MAFIMFLRRLRKEAGDADGVEVIMRYTLRLLTIQQFQRATRLISACEYIRKIDGYIELKGSKPFSIGLYVGQNTTPNWTSTCKEVEGLKDDYNLFEKLYKKDDKKYSNLELCGHTAEYAIMSWTKNEEHKLPKTENPVQILFCPWCGSKLSHKEYVIDRNKKQMDVHCGNKRCPFSRKDMPLTIFTVDDSIINNPPSLLIGTVDKFAQLTFKTDIGRLFGWQNSKQVGRPPSLIIQDELHLINGPLGSMVGLYEATIDFLSSTGLKTNIPPHATIQDLNPNFMKIEWKSRPKIIASTATIRNASIYHPKYDP